jgi:hypothetical protein
MTANTFKPPHSTPEAINDSVIDLREYLAELFWTVGVQSEIGERSAALADDALVEIATQRLVMAVRQIHSTVVQLQEMKALRKTEGAR